MKTRLCFITGFYLSLVFVLGLISFSASGSAMLEIFFEDQAAAQEYDQVEKILNESSDYLTRVSGGFIPREQFTLRVAKSLQSYQTMGLPLWLGGYYENKNAIIQPIEVLKGKEALRKTLFIEFAHFFINSFSQDHCPAWLNEMLSYYYYYQFANLTFPYLKKNEKLAHFKDFEKLEQALKNHLLARAFFNNALIFAVYMEQKKGQGFWLKILKDLQTGQKLHRIFKKRAGKTLEKIYETEIR